MNGKNILIASTAAILLVTGAGSARADQKTGSDQVRCMGVNSCKGHGGCKTARNDCKGKNGCKGQGFVMTSSAAKCQNKGGTVLSQEKSK